jgi:hypothetical protein
MYFEIVAVYRNPFEPDRFRWLYPLFVLAAATTTVTSTGYATGVAAVTGAGHAHAEEVALQLLALAFVYVPFFLFAVTGVLLHSAVREFAAAQFMPPDLVHPPRIASAVAHHRMPSSRHYVCHAEDHLRLPC